MSLSLDTKTLENGSLVVEGSLKSCPEMVTATLQNVGQSLRDFSLNVAVDSPWELVVAEALNNIVEHAYQDARDGDIRVQLEFTPTRMRAVIVDNGAPMPNETLPRGLQANLDVETQDLPEGGFGWFLIHTLTDELTYQRLDGTNQLVLALPYQSAD